MQATHAGKVGRVVPARRAGQKGKGEAGWPANGGLAHHGALGTARPTNTTNTLARNFVGPEGHARRFNNKQQQKVSNV
jgi:hypothetical protein